VRPWEETWIADPQHGLSYLLPDGWCVAIADRHEPRFSDIPRLRLAACAPEMARMLLRCLEESPPTDEEVDALLRKAGVR
jgi:hypothetical protein